MTKKKLHETVLEICSEHKASAKLTDALSELTKPKVGGSSDVNDYTCFDTDGNVTHVFCTVHKKWEPVAGVDEDGEDFGLFVADEKSKNGLRRYCDEGDKAIRELSKTRKASKSAIMQDLLDEEITGAEAKEAIADLEATNLSDAAGTRVDGLGQDDKPCVEAE